MSPRKGRLHSSGSMQPEVRMSSLMTNGEYQCAI
jgi:hypothetical protein